MKAPRGIATVECPRAVTGKLGRAWLALAGALALHVTDEALTEFLGFYNPLVLAIRERWPWLPLPTFSFGLWIAGLAALIVLLFVVSPLAFRGVRWLVVLAVPFSALMIANGLGHIGGSVWLGRLLPGFYSSPVLIGAAVWVLCRVWRVLDPLRRHL